jgi:hypothetical protein
MRAFCAALSSNSKIIASDTPLRRGVGWRNQEGVSERARHRRHRRELHATGGSETMGQYNRSEVSGQSQNTPTKGDERISETARENQREFFHMRGDREKNLILVEGAAAYITRPRSPKEKTAGGSEGTDATGKGRIEPEKVDPASSSAFRCFGSPRCSARGEKDE